MGKLFLDGTSDYKASYETGALCACNKMVRSGNKQRHLIRDIWYSFHKTREERDHFLAKTIPAIPWRFPQKKQPCRAVD